ncbi:DNA topoisomerase III (plasmid) [Mammaliicoccus sciuri]|uniref:DNA topoisomerase III n=1 Tax=Mammaliicoccus sciuri TaxID=1296 RepID=UPI002B25CE4F|nr:DNA topoisomerase III [Mammaliicoccus sciuri]WQJ67283.1 DNA topoisomerase III [Mammaliicoccus sciuri]
MKKVILAEKPSQAMDYAKALGVKQKHNGYIEIESDIVGNAIVTWAIGHLVEMKAPDEYKEPVNAWELSNLPFFPEQYEYKVAKGKSSQFNIVKKLINEADIIINATDYGREGSNIFYSILRLSGAKNKTIKRYANSSLVHEDIRRKFKDLEDNQTDLNMYKEANTRQISDWLVGMNLTSLYTNIFKNKGINEVISIGRVQTPTLYMIYERQKAIENFVSEPFYEIKGHFKADNGEYQGKAKIKTKDKTEITQIFEQHKLDNARKGKIQKIETNEKKQKSPNLFSLTELFKKASHLFNIRSKETLNIVQSLYEKKLLTYPRTDTPAITQSEFNYLLNKIEELKKAYNFDFETIYKQPRKPYVIEAIEEHHAIIPTSKVPTQSDLDSLNDKERKILNLVVSTTLSMFANDYIYDETKVETNVNDLIFYSTGKVEKDKGWKTLFSQDNDDNKEKTIKLPHLNVDEQVESKTEQIEGKTQPPKPFTDGQLIAMMETAGKSLDEEEQAILKETNGLGTEATRADIIQTLIKREYINISKNRYYVTSKGEMVCLAVKDTLLSSASMTAEWEKRLKQIGKGQVNQDSFIQMIQKFIVKELSLKEQKQNNVQIENIAEKVQQNNIIGNCPNCDNGQIHKQGKVYKCTNCEQIFFSNFFKKKLSESLIKELIINGKTKKKIKLPKKDGGTYEAYLKLEADKNKNMKVYKVSFN